MVNRRILIILEEGAQADIVITDRAASDSHFLTNQVIGIQDFNDQVLKTVNRRPSQERMEDIFAVLRDAEAKINLDFLFGLPHQTASSLSI